MPDKVKPQEFAARIKAQYPEYKDVDDFVLAQKMVEKYPEYADKVDFQTGVSGLGSLITPRESLEPTEVLRRQTGNATGQNGTSSEQSSDGGNLIGFVDEEASKRALEEEYAGGVQTLDYKPNLGFTVKSDGLGSSLTQGISTDQALENASKGTPYQRAQSERLQAQLGVYQNANPDTPLAQPTFGVVGDEESLETRGQRNAKRAQFVYNSLLSGVGSIASGVADLGMRFTSGQTGNKVLTDIMRKRFQDEVAPVIRETLINTIGANLSEEDTQRFGQEFLTGSIGGLAASIPAMVGGSARTGLFFLQAYDGAMNSINQSDTEGALSEDAKLIYATGVGAVVGKLETVGFDRIFGTATNNVAKGATFGALRAAVNEAKRNGTKVTSEMLSRHINREAGTLLSRVARGGSKILDGIKVEAATGASQELATVGSEIATNVLADSDIFEVEDLAGITERVVMAGLQEAVGGGIMGGAALVLSGSRKSKIKDAEVRAGAIEQNLQVEGLSEPALNVLAQERATIESELSAETAKAAQDFNALPEEEQAQAAELSERRDSLEAAMSDPNVSEVVKESIQKQVDDTDKQIDELIPETPTQTIEQSIGAEQGYFSMEGESGRLTTTEGGAVEFLADSGKIYELGSLEDIGQQELPSFGITFVPDNAISVKDNQVTINGKKYINPQENPSDAINRDKDGRVQSVTLQTPEGQSRTFRGSNADVIAREYALQAEPAADPVREAQEALLPAEKESKPADGIIRPLAPIVTPEEIQAPTEPQIRVNERESDEVIEQRIREEERAERKLREAPVRPASDFSTQDEYSRYIAENSNDPDQIAREYLNVAPAEPDYIEAGIAEYMGNSQINERDYRRYGDISNLDGKRAGRWINSKNSGMPLDVLAQELSDQLGVEVSPAEFIDFIDSYGSLREFKDAQKSDTQIALEDKYKQLTGQNLTQQRAENATRRFNESLTDEDIFEMDTDLQELGITYQDILNYEQFNRETTGGIQENVQQPDNDQSASQEVSGESEAAQGQPAKVKPKVPKALLEKVSEQLAKTGLAKSITLTDTAAINEALGTDNGRNINGYVDGEGNIFINQDVANLSTPIHEFGHIWETRMEEQNPALHAQGMALIQGPDGKSFVDYVKRTQPGLEGDAMYKEALAQAIGDAGATMVANQKSPGKIRDWIKKAWQWIGAQAGISKKTPEQVANMTLQQYSDAVAVDLLSGRFIKVLPDSDIVMAAPAPQSEITPAQQKKIDFMNKMRQKNGIKFQGNINAQSLSDQELREFVEFINISLEDGSIANKSDLKKIANSIGITNNGDIDLAWNIAKPQGEGVGIKKNLVNLDRLLEIDYSGLSDAEYIAEGKRMVDEGLIIPEDLVGDIIMNPRALQPREVTALIYYRANIQNELETLTDLIDKKGKGLSSFEYQGLTGDKAARVRLDAISQSIRDFELVMVSTANQQSSAFRLRSLMTDKDHNIVSFLAAGEAGQYYIAPEVVTRMKEMAKELDTVKAKLNKKGKEADALQQKINEGNIEVAASKPARPKRINTSKQAKEAFNQVVDTLDLNSFALSAPRFQANNTIRFSLQADATLADAITGAIATMRENVNGNKMSIVDAIEAAVADVDSKIGKGKWNEMAFRSAMVNSMAAQGTVLKVRKPYVASDGTLVVPGAYITSLVKDGVKGVDALVGAVKGEVGDSFTDYQVRNAISGYGRTAVKTATDTEIEVNTAKRIAKLLSKLEDLETKGEYATTPRRKFQLDKESLALMQQIKALEYNLEMTPEERAQAREAKTNANRRKYLENYIRDLNERIANKDFAPRDHKTKYEKDEETLALEAQAELIRNEFKKKKYETELANRSVVEKVQDLVYELIFNSTRALSAGADLSAMGVQGALFTVSNPIKAAKAFRSAFKYSLTEADYEQYFAEMQSDPYFEFARKAGLNLQLPSFYQSVQEEQYKGNFPTFVWDNTVARGAAQLAPLWGGDKSKTFEKVSDVNPFKIADRNYSVILSKVRFDLFKDFVRNQIAKQGLDVELDTDQLKRTAESVNTLTMASKVPVQGQTANRALSAVFFSARKLLATWKILLDVFPPTAAIRGAIKYHRNPQLAKDYYSQLGRGIGGMMAITLAPALVAYFGYDEEEDEEAPDMYNPHVLNPIHSDFMKIRLGNTRISLFQGVDGNFVFAMRIALGQMMTSSSSAVRELGSSGEKTRRDLGVDYISNKFAPTLSSFNKYYLGSDREKQEGAERFTGSLAPMWITGAIEQYQDTQNPIEAFTLGTLGIIGLSYNNYGGAEFAGAKGTNDRKAKSIVEGNGLSVYTPMAGQRHAYDGKTKSEVRGARFKEVYKPAYEEYMTAIVKASEAKINRGLHWEQKEGLIDQMKKEAYKYAEIKTSGVYMDANFAKINSNGQAYVLPKKDYPRKVEFVKEYTESKQAEVYRLRMARQIEKELRKDGLKPLPEFMEKRLDVEVYNEANRQANDKIGKLIKRKEITPILASEYIKSEDKWESEE